MSSALQWMVIRNNSSYLVKKKNIKRPFSLEPNNLRNVHSFKQNGLIHQRVLGIEPAADGKGIVLIQKRRKTNNKPAKSLVKVTLRQGPRRTLHKLKNFIMKNKYRRDLLLPALRRASALLRSQKPVVLKKKKVAPRKKE